MMVLAPKSFQVSGLSKATAGALERKAKSQGMTVDAYLKELIADDIELDRVARSKSFVELAEPFQQALKGSRIAI